MLPVSLPFSAHQGMEAELGCRSFPENAALCKSRGIRKCQGLRFWALVGPK